MVSCKQTLVSTGLGAGVVMEVTDLISICSSFCNHRDVRRFALCFLLDLALLYMLTFSCSVGWFLRSACSSWPGYSGRPSRILVRDSDSAKGWL